MSQIIPFTVSEVSNVTVGAINASGANTKASGGGAYRFGGIVLSQSGEPNKVYAVNGDNYQSILGKPLHPVKGTGALSMRYLKEALASGNGFVVPVVGSDAKRPVIGVKAPVSEDPAHIAVARVVDFGIEVSTEVDELMAIYPVDGDVTNRAVSITPVFDKAGYFTLTITKNYASGSKEKQLEQVVSFDPEATDEFGDSAYIADVLEKTKLVSIAFSADFDPVEFKTLNDVQFTGGTRGDLNNVQALDYTKAITALRNFSGAYEAVLPLGTQDPVIIKDLQGIARDRRIDAFFDVPPTLTHEAAIAWMESSAFDSQESCFYHFPYKATDLFFSGAKAVWGISSIAYGAKVKGVQSTSSSVGGYHYSPAGTERGTITRSGIEPLANIGEPDFGAMVKARINKLSTDDGKLIIDDALTATGTNTYLKFQHVVSMFNSMSRRFYSAAMKLKHQPDGITITALNDIMRDIGEDYDAVGALSKPRNPDDGDLPFTWEIKQADIDLFEVVFYACPTGSSRRIAGYPVVLK